jgi:hypothetical protein
VMFSSDGGDSMVVKARPTLDCGPAWGAEHDTDRPIPAVLCCRLGVAVAFSALYHQKTSGSTGSSRDRLARQPSMRSRLAISSGGLCGFGRLSPSVGVWGLMLAWCSLCWFLAVVLICIVPDNSVVPPVSPGPESVLQPGLLEAPHPTVSCSARLVSPALLCVCLPAC